MTNDLLRVWHIPQVPGNAFYVLVNSPEEGLKIIYLLANYDLFQFENNIKPDYSNASGLEIYEADEWVEWRDDEGDDISEYYFLDYLFTKTC